MISFSVQTDNLRMLREAVNSHCDKVRFGAEFCEVKIPSLTVLEKAHTITKKGGKGFTYVTPRFSESSLERIREQLEFLHGKGMIDVVINDLGVLNILGRYPNLRPHLGRQLVHVPSRCPWPKIGGREAVRKPLLSLRVGLKSRLVAKIYSQTSLNYGPTIRFFQSHGVQDVEVDWIPRCFPYFDFLVKNGLNLAVHLHLVPVTLTRKCHTARFLGEKSPETCHRPCITRAFLLKPTDINIKLFLYGNVVFRLIPPSQEDLKKLLKSGVTEFIIDMNPITKIQSRQEIDEFIFKLKP